jgi:hypothetical protein
MSNGSKKFTHKRQQTRTLNGVVATVCFLLLAAENFICFKYKDQQVLDLSNGLDILMGQECSVAVASVLVVLDDNDHIILLFGVLSDICRFMCVIRGIR